MSSIVFKGTSLSIVTTVIKTADLSILRQSLSEKLKRHPSFFNHEPTILDFSQFSYDKMIPWLEIFALLKTFHLVPIACQHVPEHLVEVIRSYLPVLDQAGFDLNQLSTLEHASASVSSGALIIDKPLRSGQKIYSEAQDIVVLDVVSHGAEVISDCNIHVYAPLRGRALAGARGDTSARIFTTSFEAELIAIAGIYSTFEKGLPEKFRYKPVKIRLKREETGNDVLMLEDLLF